eukprot:TRINITY_DN11434_c0_g1_i1.p1 TRINITY_DN11434_c0_g1~~TRINITY_DN11434_c0_g1_i1.p1  ORF type:complete len:381 (+),score=67.92 TRINITY_DN11434_c0_g1_i1:45-1145(+)
MSKAFTVQGTSYMRHHIVAAVLAGRSIVFDNIRPEGEEVGLKEYEVSFLKLLDLVTNGTKMEINETGTRLKIKPGVITGGKVTHQCSLTRGVGYYIEPLALLAPFSKKDMEVTLQGVTNNQLDIGVDTLRTVTIPLFRKFGVEAAIRIKKRGTDPNGGGEVIFSSQTVRKIQTIDLTTRGKIKRVRGVGFTCRTSPDLVNRAISTAKGLLLKLLPDVFIAADHFSGEDAGKSPGYGLTLVAESNSEDCVGLSEELACDITAMQKQVTAEEIGTAAAKLLLDQVKRGGCVDSHHQATALLLMAVSPEEISRVRFGQLTPAGEKCIEICRELLSVTFTSKVDNTYTYSPTTVYSCVGCSLTNVSKKSA